MKDNYYQTRELWRVLVSENTNRTVYFIILLPFALITCLLFVIIETIIGILDWVIHPSS